jgi:O-antigen ligase
MVPDIRQLFVSVLQREMTLTGRTDLWTDLLSEQINPLIGVGYQSFWLGPVAQQYWEKYSFHPNQAHNGYLELYLNGGIIAVFLLVAMMVSAGRRLKADLLAGKSFAIFCFSFLVVALVYNWTEAMFSKMTIVWFVLIMIALYRGDIIEAGVGNSEPKRQG